MKRKPSGALILSIGLHLVLIVGLVWLMAVPLPFQKWLADHKDVPVEKIGYFQVPNEGVTRQGRNGGNNIPKERTQARPFVAPSTTPTTIPKASSRASSPTGGQGTGPKVGIGGAESGITPSFSDPRLWLPPGPVMGVPRSQSQRLDSVIMARLQPHLDSLEAIAAHQGKAPGDWTFTKDGKKWGMDPKNIYIGDHAIPTAILALLPLNKGANPITSGENKAFAYQHQDIQFNAQRAMNEEEFNEAVKRIRERKQREHDEDQKDRQRRKQQADSTIAQP
ncbi:MAG TPA: hypothetical protein VIC24_04590 [Gemmatimonadaceae bacterium]